MNTQELKGRTSLLIAWTTHYAILLKECQRQIRHQERIMTLRSVLFVVTQKIWKCFKDRLISFATIFGQSNQVELKTIEKKR